jgi:hypothetical protein
MLRLVSFEELNRQIHIRTVMFLSVCVNLVGLRPPLNFFKKWVGLDWCQHGLQ